jgi:Kelch motif protein/galactose oxidase-like protein
VYSAHRPAVLAIPLMSLCLLVSCKSESPALQPHGWLQLSGPSPSPRWTHAAVLDPVRRNAVLFGGFGAGNEVWIFSFDSLTWTRVDAPNGPSPRGSPAAVADPARDRMVVVGGWPGPGSSPLDDVWAFSFANHTWSALPKGPSARFDMGAATDNIHAWFYGGYVAFQATDEIWQFDLASNTWTALPQSQVRPSPRTNMGIGVHEGSLFIVGGHDTNGLTPGIWRYELSSQNWTQLSPFGTLGAEAHFASAGDSACGVLLLAGGDHDDGIDVSTTDVFSYFKDSFVRLPTMMDFSPSRRHSVLVLEPRSRSLMLFGGINDPSKLLGDTWLYQLGGCSY